METISHLIRDAAYELSGDPGDYASLIDSIGTRSFVLLGEATHGTKEFYRHRAKITKELILHHGFNAIAIEADWPDTCRLDNPNTNGNKYLLMELSMCKHERYRESRADELNRYERWEVSKEVKQM